MPRRTGFQGKEKQQRKSSKPTAYMSSFLCDIFLSKINDPESIMMTKTGTSIRKTRGKICPENSHLILISSHQRTFNTSTQNRMSNQLSELITPFQYCFMNNGAVS